MPDKNLQNQLTALNKRIADLITQRNNTLRELRQKCRHLRLVELDASPPRRMCVDCGAEEDGWGCGYHVLVTSRDFFYRAPHRNERVLVERTTDGYKFYKYRQDGPLYLVGQNHPKFVGAGLRTYKQLTEVLEQTFLNTHSAILPDGFLITRVRIPKTKRLNGACR